MFFNVAIVVGNLFDRDVIIYFAFPNMFRSLCDHYQRNSQWSHKTVTNRGFMVYIVHVKYS
jgi:hypothetical protein